MTQENQNQNSSSSENVSLPTPNPPSLETPVSQNHPPLPEARIFSLTTASSPSISSTNLYLSGQHYC